MLQFTDFGVEQREKVQSYTLKSCYRNCDLAFSNLFVWKFLFDTKIAEKDGFLFVKYKNKDKLYYMLPIGEGDLGNAIKTIIDDSNQQSRCFRMQGLSPKMKERIDELFPKFFDFISKPNYSDYIYLREDLANLTGKKYQPKRNYVNQFKRNYPTYSVIDITHEIIPRCLDLATRWEQNNSDSEKSVALAAEKKAIFNAFSNFEALDLLGKAIVVDNKVVAFSYGSPINSTTFDVSVEKADANYVGAYAIINNEFAKSVPQNFMYINREEDLGIEGLRKAKLSYHPAVILEKYTANFCNE